MFLCTTKSDSNTKLKKNEKEEHAWEQSEIIQEWKRKEDTLRDSLREVRSWETGNEGRTRRVHKKRKKTTMIEKRESENQKNVQRECKRVSQEWGDRQEWNTWKLGVKEWRKYTKSTHRRHKRQGTESRFLCKKTYQSFIWSFVASSILLLSLRCVMMINIKFHCHEYHHHRYKGEASTDISCHYSSREQDLLLWMEIALTFSSHLLLLPPFLFQATTHKSCFRVVCKRCSSQTCSNLLTELRSRSFSALIERVSSEFRQKMKESPFLYYDSIVSWQLMECQTQLPINLVSFCARQKQLGSRKFCWFSCEVKKHFGRSKNWVWC
jgi:hypothetical protein